MLSLSSFIASSLSNGSKLDAADALSSCAMPSLNTEWIYSVDPETFAEVKAAYKAYATTVDGNVSLYKVFCTAARQGKQFL